MYEFTINSRDLSVAPAVLLKRRWNIGTEEYTIRGFGGVNWFPVWEESRDLNATDRLYELMSCDREIRRRLDTFDTWNDDHLQEFWDYMDTHYDLTREMRGFEHEAREIVEEHEGWDTGCEDYDWHLNCRLDNAWVRAYDLMVLETDCTIYGFADHWEATHPADEDADELVAA